METAPPFSVPDDIKKEFIRADYWLDAIEKMESGLRLHLSDHEHSATTIDISFERFRTRDELMGALKETAIRLQSSDTTHFLARRKKFAA